MPDVIKFVLRYGERNLLCNRELKYPATSNGLESDDAGGEPMDQPVQRCRVTFGCCRQNFSEEYVDNGSGKDVTYGFGMFEEEDDAAFHSLVKQMLANAFDRMQMCEDEIETTKLKNPLPFNHKGHDELFAKFVHRNPQWNACSKVKTYNIGEEPSSDEENECSISDECVSSVGGSSGSITSRPDSFKSITKSSFNGVSRQPVLGQSIIGPVLNLHYAAPPPREDSLRRNLGAPKNMATQSLTMAVKALRLL
jgi:hypothetical protein